MEIDIFGKDIKSYYLIKISMLFLLGISVFILATAGRESNLSQTQILSIHVLFICSGLVSLAEITTRIKTSVNEEAFSIILDSLICINYALGFNNTMSMIVIFALWMTIRICILLNKRMNQKNYSK